MSAPDHAPSLPKILLASTGASTHVHDDDVALAQAFAAAAATVAAREAYAKGSSLLRPICDGKLRFDAIRTQVLADRVPRQPGAPVRRDISRIEK